MAESKKVVVVGIPGVGKTTLINKIVELIKDHNKSVKVTNFGTIMFEVAKENGVNNRDELRKLPLSEQKKLQKNAAEKLSKIDDDVVIIDTHAFIRTPEGFNPGLPYHVLQIIEPSNFISVNAKTEEIYNRRMKDETRTRDKVSIATIKKELDIQSAMMSACSVLSGSPLKHVMNSEGKLDEAADQIIKAIGL
ncbi:MAG: adenylate kinase [Nitrosopumilaceae archaeon]|uniref:Adenylate kinase n=3 Tax=Candidatus Nitrosomaritimum aestuariumsis TaxID=3342354 RepID=A0AC60W4I2_9ARCH|nr:adenylate kinase [Nitrosopumilaceae archaeon]MBA4454640.1 adenylate kinase [Nitrosopumilaceae archaeon]MBA4459560.1 adenylate kinase [Nitrosopumilaceae archaeon]MBA4461319.1 adenylate kinase [Nitrosopumilaceae archaeon]MBA4462851.1 adenylate kinase [Nitrosopumilaceae archaeon]